MSYAVSEADIDLVYQGITELYKPKPDLIKVEKKTDENGITTFKFDMGFLGSIHFIKDENGMFQFEKFVDEIDAGRINFSFHYYMKQFTGKDWPSV